MSASTNPTVFVCGATGSQGGALARQLRELDWAVHATVRNLTSPVAQSLKAAGVHLTQGDWDDSAALASAMAGCDKLFLCLLPDFSDMNRERQQAEGIVKIAKAAGVNQVVASTSLGVFTLDEAKEQVAPDSFMAQHLAGKKGVEEAVRNGGFDHWTFLRPAFFMANFLEPKVARYPEPRDTGTWTTAMTPEAPLALIDHADIAAFAVAAFRHPARFHDRAVGLASEMLTVQETLTLLGRAAGRPLRAVFMTDEEIAEKQKNSNVFTNSQVSMRYMSKYIDMDEITSAIRPTPFRDFLEREKEGVKKTYP
ncbi:NmrA family protein [Hypoxylon rubiginosum]|uniref:NmrA family protein n=1 Tax=Hypoxylon rubiginosum TaxID=110542 RepID=A0ACB9YJR6_9PEZI|nr:NmrA family protein [Hypoxylon rubiginosum]